MASNIGKIAAKASNDGIEILSTGVRAKITPVATALMDEVTNAVPTPTPPTWHNERSGKDEPNFDHPDYLAQLRVVERKRGQAAIDAMIMFGVTLVDGVPELDEWLPKLKYLAKRGAVNLDEYDLDDDMDVEFVYKRFIAVASQDLALVSRRSGLTEEGIQKAGDTFPSN